MTTAHRAFLGAIIGAIFALFLHPLSRPWLQFGLWRFGHTPAVTSSPHLAKTLTSLPSPDSDEKLSLSVQLANQRLAAGESLDRKEALLLTELCRGAAEKDALNAFWRQNESVFQYALGNAEAAQVAWNRAARRSKWNDFQGTQIQRYLDDLEADSRAEMSWHAAAAIHYRSSDSAQVIYSLGMTLLDQDQSLANRADTFLNAVLIRDHARIREASRFGHDLAETAATGPFPVPGSTRERTFVRAEFPTQLHQEYQPAIGDRVAAGLRENDAFLALAYTDQKPIILRRMTGQAILLSSTPGTLMLASILGGIVLVALYCVPLHRLGDPPPPSLPAGLGLIAGIGFYLLTNQILPSLWALLVIALFALRPPISLISPAIKVPKSALLFGSIFGIGLTAIVVATGVVFSTPFQSLASELPPGWWQNPTPFLAANALLVLGAFILFSQLIAFKLRRPAGRFCIILARHGLAQASLACLFLSIVTTPTAILLDNKLNQDLRKIALNETSYYLNR